MGKKLLTFNVLIRLGTRTLRSLCAVTRLSRIERSNSVDTV